MQFGVTPASVERVLGLDGKRYFLATSEQVSQVEGVRRSWDVKRVARQEGDPTQEFTIPLNSFHNGSGFTFSAEAGVYEIADGWDLSAPGKATSWPLLTTLESFDSRLNIRGWVYWNAASGYLYILRGRYAVKYLPDDTTDEWPIVAFHQFGVAASVCGKPAEFQGKLYVPVGSTDGTTLGQWHELDTIESSPVTEVQTLTESGSPNGGTFAITYNDGIVTTNTANLAFNATAADVEAAFDAIEHCKGFTVTRTGTTTNFVWTVTMTGATTSQSTSSPPTLAIVNNLTGGAGPAIAVATTTAGTGDKWDTSESGVEARTFCVWQKPTVGPLLVRANANEISTCSTTPTTAANWSTGQEVGDTGADITALATLGRLLFIGKEDGVWSLDETGQGVNEIPAIKDVRDRFNCVAMREFNGYLLIPHKVGLIRWRPGSTYSIVGAEHEGLLEGDRSSGWGLVAGLAPYGKYCYETMNDLYNQQGIVSSLQAPGGTRGALTPHMHQSIDSFVEDCGIGGIIQQPVSGLAPATWSDDNAVGTIAWTNPDGAATDSEYASFSTPGVSHYLKGLNPGSSIPDGATITGIRLDVQHQAATDLPSETFIYTGADQTYVVPAGVTSILVDVRGAQGGGTAGGRGGRVQTRITVTPAETLHITVGGAGTDQAVGGYNGGGNGGTPVGIGYTFHGGGGGASDIRQGGTGLGNRVVVAGGGGGSGQVGGAVGTTPTVAGGAGGAGGGTTGASGSNISFNGVTVHGGGGGTASAGGNGPGTSTDGASGTGGVGGDMVTDSNGLRSQPGPGGGGGYYGGGGGEPGFTEGVIGNGFSSPSAGGGGGSSYVSSGTGTVHTQGYQSGNGSVTITAGDATDLVDTTVRLVRGGTVVGNNKAATTTQWPNNATTVTYGSSTDKWGTTWTVAQVNATDFGFVLSATLASGEARVNKAKLYVHYSTDGIADPGSFMCVITVDSTRTETTPYIYKLPRAGLPVANDPNINKAISDATFKTARYFAPSRNTQKEYRSTELYVELDPEDNIPGFQLWASVDDSDFFPLLDSSGDAATIQTSGAYELFFPQTASSIGRWVQLRPTVPSLSGDEVPVAVTLRDITIHGAWLPKMTEEIQAVVVLKEGGQFSDNYTERRTVEQQLADFDALNNPRLAGRTPIALHDPVQRTDTRCIVHDIQLRPIRFKESHEETWVAILQLRKAPFE